MAYASDENPSSIRGVAATPSSTELVKRLDEILRRLAIIKQRVHDIGDTLWGATPTEVAERSMEKPSHSTLNAVGSIEQLMTEISGELERF